MIRGIFFDAGGVLYQRTSPTGEFALQLLRQEGYVTTPTAQQSQLLEGMRAKASQGRISHTAYWMEYLRLHGVQSAVRREGLLTQITDFSNAVLPVPGCAETLAGLKARYFILGIVTDTIYPLEWKMRRLERAGVAGLMDVVACSSTLGVHKPHPAIYLDALRQAGLQAHEAAFVGHDAKELWGAHQAGLATVAILYAGQVQADFYCQSWKELLDIPIFQVNTPALV